MLVWKLILHLLSAYVYNSYKIEEQCIQNGWKQIFDEIYLLHLLNDCTFAGFSCTCDPKRIRVTN